jgi:hypothetical protein
MHKYYSWTIAKPVIGYGLTLKLEGFGKFERMTHLIALVDFPRPGGLVASDRAFRSSSPFEAVALC